MEEVFKQKGQTYIRVELLEAFVRIFQVNGRNLPGHVHGSCDKREVEVRSIGSDNLTSDVKERDETDSEDREEDLWAIVLQDQSGGFNTSLRVIMLILSCK